MKDLNPGASPQEWFGNELRELRKAAGLSAATLGRLVQVSDDMILAIEKGKYPSCRRDVAQRLDAYFETGGFFDRAWPMVFGNRDADKKQADADKHAAGRREGTAQARSSRILSGDEPSPLPGSHEPVDRRSFLQVSGLAAFAPIDLTQAFAPSGLSLPESVSLGQIDQVLAAATAISGMDNKLGGGGMVRDVASSAMQWSAGLLQVHCAEHLRADLFAAVSRLGIVVGASAFDAYHHGEATKTFKFAADCAEEAGDWHLRAKTYSFLARQAVWIGSPDDGLTYAEKGLVRSDRLTATEQAMLHTARARAFGKMGNVRDTMAAVGAADEAFTRARPSEDPPWMAYYDAAQHNGDTAHALFDLAILAGQDPGRAAGRFNMAVKGHSDSFKRSRAISRTKLAALMMAKGDPRQAALIGHDALDEVGRLTSRRAADDLRQLGHFAARHQKVQEASGLRERITATVSA
ncbi:MULTISPECIES: helix-turn-helix transcriptional regulator [unclassified Streptomyces]|uniref:helix-turn-helix transcriptional regulator n=1 Tax=unclassified Streptomyces TaxID=2593676 RepID=UPI002E0D6F19|nr:helix-turn-helix domain-containing protein [Streptomyces sp. NBC_01197]WSS49048.1 helix-turn-helix domain-containing protein [Streptomyces sp. NBC_01180]